jgi:hypothetical protein
MLGSGPARMASPLISLRSNDATCVSSSFIVSCASFSSGRDGDRASGRGVGGKELAAGFGVSRWLIESSSSDVATTWSSYGTSYASGAGSGSGSETGWVGALLVSSWCPPRLVSVLFQLVLSRPSHLLWLLFYFLRFLSSCLPPIPLSSRPVRFDREPFGLLADALFFECGDLCWGESELGGCRLWVYVGCRVE